MGMRATIGYIDTDKTMKLTTVQWSTMLDRTFGYYASRELENEEDPIEGVRELVKYVTDHYQHISCFEITDNTSVDGLVHLAHDVCVSGPQERESGDYGIFPADTSENHRKNARYFHLDHGSVGVLIDANSTSESVEFFYINDDYDTEEVQCSVISLYELAEFYAKANEGHDLMKLPFRVSS